MPRSKVSYEGRLQVQRKRQEELAASQKALRDHSKGNSKAAIEDAFANPAPSGTGGVAGAISRAMANKEPADREAFKRIFMACEKTKLSDPDRRYFDALFQLATWHGRWVRQPEEWKCKTNNPDRQFHSLAIHLVANYDVPLFMDSVWRSSLRLYQEWYINVGQGENIRKQRGMPIELTKRMAHEMMHSPAGFSIMQAIRRGQVIGLGGSDRCAHAVIATPIGEVFTNAEDEFWVSVIRFFIANPMLDTVHYGPIVDYLRTQKFMSQGNVLVDDRVQAIPPPQPGLSMAGRTPEVLIAQVERWHKNISKASQRRYQAWNPCGVPGTEIVEGQGESKTVWTIRELLDSTSLANEGKAMHHCVGSYVGSCANGNVAIYSMILTDKTGSWHSLTIEVTPSVRAIRQARGLRNAWPSQLHTRILRRWAEKANLRIDSYALGG